MGFFLLCCDLPLHSTLLLPSSVFCLFHIFRSPRPLSFNTTLIIMSGHNGCAYLIQRNFITKYILEKENYHHVNKKKSDRRNWRQNDVEHKMTLHLKCIVRTYKSFTKISYLIFHHHYQGLYSYSSFSRAICARGNSWKWNNFSSNYKYNFDVH